MVLSYWDLAMVAERKRFVQPVLKPAGCDLLDYNRRGG